MNIETLSSYAGIVEAIVVVISLVYLTFQMRQNTLMMRAQAVQGLTDSNMSVYATVMLESTIWRKGMVSLDDLNDDEKIKFLLLCGQYTRAFDTTFCQYKAGILPFELWEGMEKTLMATSTSKGYRQFWKLRSPFFSKGFKEWMEKEVLVNAESDDYIQSIKGENTR